MRFFTRFAIYFYVLIIAAMSSFLLSFVLHVISLQNLEYYLGIGYADPRVRICLGILGGALILLSLVFAKIVVGGKQKERTIAFDNPSGRVSVSLFAVEDLVKRVMLRMPEVKEARPDIIASKKGIEIETRLVLNTDVNIPEMTSRLQEMVKHKIQEMLGLEETVTIRIHVMKIADDEIRAKKKDVEEKPEPVFPFQGYQGYRSGI